MFKTLIMTTFLATGAFGTAAYAEGDAAEGESLFNRCKACHAIANGDETIVRGGRVGPNLFNIVGTAAATAEGFRYGDALLAAGVAGLVWSEENITEYAADPTAFLRAFLDDSSARSKMTFKLNRGAEHVAAFLASHSAEAAE